MLLGILALLTGCETAHYYAQATAGQIGILWRRERIQHLIQSSDTNPELRRRLVEVGDMLRFAHDTLLLPSKSQFSSYVEVNGEYVVWNVFATPEFSTEPTLWCYPIIGCASYRGYFKARNARSLARRLSATRHDAAVGGVVAYSTLGWFDDPLLSTYINWQPVELAGLLFHELAHVRLFVKDDTVFNEGFATFVEREGVREWLTANGDAAEIRRVEVRWQRSDQLVAFMLEWRSQLAKLYAQPFNDMARRMLKDDMITEIARCMHVNGGLLGESATTALLRKPINNASLVPFAAYNEYVDGFAALFDESGRSWQRFFDRADGLARSKPAQRAAAMRELSRPHGSARQRSNAGVHCATLSYGDAS